MKSRTIRYIVLSLCMYDIHLQYLHGQIMDTESRNTILSTIKCRADLIFPTEFILEIEKQKVNSDPELWIKKTKHSRLNKQKWVRRWLLYLYVLE